LDELTGERFDLSLDVGDGSIVARVFEGL